MAVAGNGKVLISSRLSLVGYCLPGRIQPLLRRRPHLCKLRLSPHRSSPSHHRHGRRVCSRAVAQPIASKPFRHRRLTSSLMLLGGGLAYVLSSTLLCMSTKRKTTAVSTFKSVPLLLARIVLNKVLGHDRFKYQMRYGRAKLG